MKAVQTYGPLSLLTVVLLTTWNARGADALLPRPPQDALVKAGDKVRELYQADIQKAAKPADKSALAKVLLNAPDAIEQDNASRLALWTMARDLAVSANDGSLATQIVTSIAGRFQPDGPTDPQEQIKRGNAVWTQAQAAAADKRLGIQVQAAEWYIRAKPSVTGLDGVLVTKRLDEVLSAKPSSETSSPTPSRQKTFSVTYQMMRLKGKPVATDLIHANSEEAAKQAVLKVHPAAKFLDIQQK